MLYTPFVPNLDSLGRRGIYVILDMHQDALSSKFGSYDGAPLWLIDVFPKPEHAYPWPFSAKPSQWGLNYVTGACGTAFDDLYKNQSRAVDHLKFFWQTVAKRFGQKDNVLGYELINEPWPGDVLADPLLFIPGKAGSERLMPLYNKLALAIADVDQSTIIFYEPVTWGMIIHGKELGSGFTNVPGGDNFKHRAVFSFHYYCWFAGSYQVKVFPAWLRDLCDHLFFPDVVSAVTKNVQETGGGMFLTEFGLCNANAPHTSTSYQECLSVLQHSDVYSLSWTYWDSEFFFPNGSVNIKNVKLFSRPYPMAIAGRPIMSEFDANSRLFVFQFLPSAHKTTFLFLPAIHYPTGYKVEGAGTVCTVTGRPVVEVTCTTETIVTLQFLPQT